MPTPDAQPHELVIVPPAGTLQHEELKQKCYDIRIAVFIDEQKFDLADEFDDIDACATHFLLRDPNTLVGIGTIRCHRTPKGYYKLTRLAILSTYRSYGFGRFLVGGLHDWVRQDAQSHGARTAEVVLHSQMHAIRFYQKFGYVAEGPEFDEDGAPHQRMVLNLQI